MAGFVNQCRMPGFARRCERCVTDLDPTETSRLDDGVELVDSCSDANVMQHVDQQLATDLVGHLDGVERSARVGPGHVLEADAQPARCAFDGERGQRRHRHRTVRVVRDDQYRLRPDRGSCVEQRFGIRRVGRDAIHLGAENPDADAFSVRSDLAQGSGAVFARQAEVDAVEAGSGSGIDQNRSGLVEHRPCREDEAARPLHTPIVRTQERS